MLDGLWAVFHFEETSGFDELCDFDPPMRVQHSCQSLLLVLSLPSTARTRRSEYTGYLGKHAYRVDRVDVGDDVAVRVLVLEEERAEVGLATLHHVLDGGDDLWVLDDDGLVESGEERATGNGQGKDLGVDLGDGLFGDGTGV